MDLSFNYLQRLICHKKQPFNQPTNQPTNSFYNNNNNNDNNMYVVKL